MHRSVASLRLEDVSIPPLPPLPRTEQRAEELAPKAKRGILQGQAERCLSRALESVRWIPFCSGNAGLYS